MIRLAGWWRESKGCGFSWFQKGFQHHFILIDRFIYHGLNGKKGGGLTIVPHARLKGMWPATQSPAGGQSPVVWNLEEWLIHKIDMLLLRRPRKSGEMGTEELHKVQQISRPVPGEEHHKAPAYAGGHKGLAEKNLKILVDTKPAMCPQKQRQLMECWATLGRVSPTGGERWFFPSTKPWWGHIWSLLSISGHPSTRKIQVYY